MSDFTVCKLCIIKRGLRASELEAGTCDYAFKNEADFNRHLELVHGIKTGED